MSEYMGLYGPAAEIARRFSKASDSSYYSTDEYKLLRHKALKLVKAQQGTTMRAKMADVLAIIEATS